jgi:hypothetical protein
MRIPTHLAAALVAGVALTGCGAEEAATAGSEDRQQQAKDAMLAYTKCMREHGVDIPDPEPGERGLRMVAPEGVSREEMREAEEACRKHLEEFEPPELSEEQQEEMKERALAHARCMREHGIENFPDPTFGEGGRTTMRIGPEDGIDPNSEKFKEAEEACRDELPEMRAPEESSP